MYSVLLSAVLAGAGTAPADTYGSYGSYGGNRGSTYGYYPQPLILPTYPYVDQGYYTIPQPGRPGMEPLPYGTTPYSTPAHAPYTKNPWIRTEPQPRLPAAPAKPPSSTLRPQASVAKPQGTTSKLSVRYLDKTGQTEEPPLLIRGVDRVPAEAPRSSARPAVKPTIRAPEVRKEESPKAADKARTPKVLDRPKAPQAPAEPRTPSRPTERPGRNDPFALDNKLSVPALASSAAAADAKGTAKSFAGDGGHVKPGMSANTDERKGTLTSLKEEKADAERVPANRARLIVTLPPNAKLFVNGQVVQTVTNPSSYLTPELRNDTRYFYTVHVEVAQSGSTLVSEARQVFFQPGGEARVSFENAAVFMPSATPGSL
jgi:uncharacterized protein (TIGR03000 family)